MEEIMTYGLERTNAKKKIAGKILDYYDFDDERIHEMVQDMNVEFTEFFRSVCNSEERTAEMYGYIQEERGNYRRHDLAEWMTREAVEADSIIDEQAVKQWFYRLYPAFELEKIEDRYYSITSEVARDAIAQLDPDLRSMLFQKAKSAVEFHDFDPDKLEYDMCKTLYAMFHKKDNNVKKITVEMCLEAVKEIFSNVEQLKAEIEAKRNRPKYHIEDDKLKEMCTRIRNYQERIGKESEYWALFVETLFFEHADEYTFDEIKERAKTFLDDIGEPPYQVDDSNSSVENESDESRSPYAKRRKLEEIYHYLHGFAEEDD